MKNHFSPKPGRFGTMITCVQSAPIGGANYIGGASPLTANTTTTFRLGSFPHKAILSRWSASCLQVPVDADGTILATLQKYSATATAQVQIGAQIDLEALVTRQQTYAGTYTSATDAQLLINEGDTLEVNVVSNSAAIDTQPTQLIFVAELLVQE